MTTEDDYQIKTDELLFSDVSFLNADEEFKEQFYELLNTMWAKKVIDVLSAS